MAFKAHINDVIVKEEKHRQTTQPKIYFEHQTLSGWKSLFPFFCVPKLTVQLEFMSSNRLCLLSFLML